MPYTYNPMTGQLDYYSTSSVSSGTITAHDELTGLSNDDHTQYLTEGRGDIRYYTKAEVDTISGSLNDKITTTSINAIPSSDLSAKGPHINTIAAGEFISAIDCVYIGTEGEWWKTNATTIASGGGMLAVSLESKTDGLAMDVALPGSFVRNDAWSWSLTTEQGRVYLDTVIPGGLTQTPPSGEDNLVRIAGYAITSNVIYFNPEIAIIHS